MNRAAHVVAQRNLESARCATSNRHDQAVRRLTYLDNAEALQDLAGLASNRLEALRGDRAGQYSIRINAQ